MATKTKTELLAEIEALNKEMNSKVSYRPYR